MSRNEVLAVEKAGNCSSTLGKDSYVVRYLLLCMCHYIRHLGFVVRSSSCQEDERDGRLNKSAISGFHPVHPVHRGYFSRNGDLHCGGSSLG